jgi:hypothetical protein
MERMASSLKRAYEKKKWKKVEMKLRVQPHQDNENKESLAGGMLGGEYLLNNNYVYYLAGI